MTTRTNQVAVLAARTFDASDVENWSVFQAADAIEAVHSFPDGQLVATQPGARLSLVAYPDAEIGTALVPAQPFVPAENPIPPDFETGMTLTGSLTGTGAVSDGWIDLVGPVFAAFDLVVPFEPSGVVWDQGSSLNGTYVGFVAGDLVVRVGLQHDLRIDAENVGIAGKTGTIYVEITTGSSVRVWWLEDQTVQVVLIGSSLGGALPGPWGQTGGRVGTVTGTANIEDGDTAPPFIRDVAQTDQIGSDRAFALPSFVAGDTLFATVTMHTGGQDGAADCTISGWTRILDYDGAPNSYGPCVFMFAKTAAANESTPSITVSGPTIAWQKTVTCKSLGNATNIVPQFGETADSSDTEIGFPPAVVGSQLTMRLLTCSNTVNVLPIPVGDTELASNEPYFRAQQWSTGPTAATLSTGLVSTSYSTAVVSMQGDTIGEGTAPFNGTITQARFYQQPAPSDILDPGSFGVPAIPAVPEIPAAPYTSGSPGVWPNSTAGEFLETVRVSITQSRTGAGVWSARMFAVSPDGEVRRSAEVAAPFDLADDGELRETVLAAQTAVGDGSLLDDLVLQGWSLGVTLETVTSGVDEPFGEARLDVAQMVLQWVTPPEPTITFPADGVQMETATPQAGWIVPLTDTQTGYELRIWEADTFDPNDPDAGRIVYSSCRVNSSAVRSHQSTYPLEPNQPYVVGVRLFGEQVNGRTLTSRFETVEIVAPEPHVDDSTMEQAYAIECDDGTVLVASGVFDNGEICDWLLVERANVSELQAATDPEAVWSSVSPFGQLSQPSTIGVGQPHVRFVDHTAPVGVELAYRIRAIRERGPFDIQSSTWGYSNVIVVDSATGWLSTLDGSRRARINPTDISWTRDLPNQVAAGVGAVGHIVSRDVRKAADLTVSVATYERAEFEAFTDLVEPGDHLWLRDPHGRVFLVQPIGDVSYDPQRALATSLEVSPTRHVYRMASRMIEVEDPRDFGFGCGR